MLILVYCLSVFTTSNSVLFSHIINPMHICRLVIICKSHWNIDQLSVKGIKSDRRLCTTPPTWMDMCPELLAYMTSDFLGCPLQYTVRDLFYVPERQRINLKSWHFSELRNNLLAAQVWNVCPVIETFARWPLKCWLLQLTCLLAIMDVVDIRICKPGNQGVYS